MFEFVKNNAGQNFPIIKQMPATAATTYHVGEALGLTSGKLAKVTGATAPEYICAEEATGKDYVSVYPITDGQEWLTTFSASAASIVPGNKVTIHTDSAQVTATTTSGVAEVLRMYGTAAGDKAIVKF